MKFMPICLSSEPNITLFASVSETAAQNSISFGAPSKTFNIAGLVSSYAIVPNETIRKRFFDWLTANELNEPTFMATIATEAAYNHCREWREQMLAYIEQNILFVEEFLDCHIPAIKAIRPLTFVRAILYRL